MPSGKHRKKKRPSKEVEPEDAYKPPKSFIFRRGKVGQTVKQLVEDMRQVMSPNTAVNLQEKESNTLKDFVHVSNQLGISQFFAFSATELGTYLRLLRVPHGPTLTFRLMSYSLMSDIHKLQTRPKTLTAEDKMCAPILILNNFSSEENHIKLMASAFQNAFPALNVHLMKLKDARRVVLLHYDKEDGLVEFRHYLITTTQLGITKSVKRVLQRKMSDMGDVKDISDFILSQTGATESDAEDMANVDGQIDLPDNVTKKKKRRFTKKKIKKDEPQDDKDEDGEEGEEMEVDDADSAAPSVADSSSLPQKFVKSAVRLVEIGPRLQMKLIKVEEGFNDGLVLYHALKTKTEKEVQALERKRYKAAQLKERRKKEQEERIARKKGISVDGDGDADVESGDDEKNLHEDYKYEHAPEEVIRKPDDVEWYRREVGEEPTDELKRELQASQPDNGKQGKFNPHWAKKSKKRTGDQVTGGRGSEKSSDGKPAKKKFKSISGSVKRTK